MSVKINIRTTIFHDRSNKEIIEAAAQGEFFKKENASFLQYEELGDNGSIRTIVKIAGSEALILRSGAVKMRLPFALNKRMNGSYELPFGLLAARTVAKRIEHTYNEENGKGSINLLYDLLMQGTKTAGTYHLEITFQEEEV